jgi:predicted CXXCH cytochrome family protein
MLTHRVSIGLAGLALFVILGAPPRAAATSGAYRESPHGSRTTGVLRSPGARGDCVHCHGGSKDPRARFASPMKQSFTPTGNDDCISCHDTPARGPSWLGGDLYGRSLHGIAPAMVWPGPTPRARPSSDAGKCVNCHDPHGTKDQAGLIPAMLRVRGPALCFRCHDGTVAANVATAFSKAYRHPLVASGGSSGAPGGPQFAATATFVTRPGRNGPATDETCAGCHDPHTAGPACGAAPFSTDAPSLLGAPRVRVANGPSGATPTLTAVAAGDTSPAREHEVCLRCHSGARPGDVRVTADIGAALNSNNASFHPVEAPGRNATVDPRTFTQGWSADRPVRCSDCHAPDGGAGRGTHGSAYPHILKKPYPSGAGQRTISAGDLCFDCHRYAVYGDPAGGSEGALSRFSGHGSHSGKGLSCWTCHDAHGSADLPGLLVLRSPGLTTYSRDVAAASCTTTCHVAAPRAITTRMMKRR